MTTTPLTKAIATLEGVVLAVAATVPWVVSLVDPNTLPQGVAAKWSVISGIALVVSRTALKATAVVKGVTGVTPEPVDVEALARRIVAHAGVMVPSTDELRKIVSEAVKVAADPKDVIEQLAGAIGIEAHVAAAPVSATPPADGDNATVSVAQNAPAVAPVAVS